MRFKPILTIATFIAFAPGMLAQMAQGYEIAAQGLESGANRCQSAPAASCMRQNASYYRCVAGSLQSGAPACQMSRPTCSAVCPISSSSGAGGGLGASKAKGNQSVQLANEIGDLLGQWAAAREAKHEREARDLERKVQQEEAQMEADSKAEDEHARERAAFLADPSALTATGGQPGRGAIDPMVALRNQMTAMANSQGPVDPGVTPIGDATKNVQYENLDHPGVASEIDYGKPQDALPLYKWTPQGTDPSNSYCQAQPNVPCEQVPNAAGPRDQFSTPPNVTSPTSSSDCDALEASWQQTTSAISDNHGACLAYYQGQGRVGTGSETATLCKFQACQEIHNSMVRSTAQGVAAVQACRQAVAPSQP